MRSVALGLCRLALLGALVYGPLHLHALSPDRGGSAPVVTKEAAASISDPCAMHTHSHTSFARASLAHLPPTPPATSPRPQFGWPRQRPVDLYTLLSQYRI